jgi:hypothetical protein
MRFLGLGLSEAIPDMAMSSRSSRDRELYRRQRAAEKRRQRLERRKLALEQAYAAICDPSRARVAEHRLAQLLGPEPDPAELEREQHDVTNGLLLRRDLHSLFDRGYVTVTPRLRFEVSHRIREEFENGRDYYALHGRQVHVPDKLTVRPDSAALIWHNENRYLG